MILSRSGIVPDEKGKFAPLQEAKWEQSSGAQTHDVYPGKFSGTLQTKNVFLILVYNQMI